MPKGPNRRKNGSTSPQSSLLALANLGELNALSPMHFRVPTQFHREFKTYAALEGMSMVDLLQESFHYFKQHRPR